MNACKSECDCCPYPDPETGGEVHASDCHSQVECDEDRMCDKHEAEAMAEHVWMRGKSHGAVFGFMNDAEKQQLRDAGRGHLLNDFDALVMP